MNYKEVCQHLESVMTRLERTDNVDIEMPTRIKPGTRLVREWQGEWHEVTVLEKLLAYRGQQFDSLSEVAKGITGTRWSDLVIFGLNPLCASGGMKFNA